MFWKKSNPAAPHSITVRLASMVALLIALMLTTLCLGLYKLVSWRLTAEENRFMDDAVSVLQTTLASKPDSRSILHDQLPRELAAFHFHHYLVRIVERRDGPPAAKPAEMVNSAPTLFQSDNFPQTLIPLFDRIPIDNSPYPQQDGQIFQLPSGQSYLLLAAPARLAQAGASPVVIQMALNITPKMRVLQQLQIFLILTALASVLIAGFLSGWVVRRGLRPLHQMGERIRQIDTGSLEQRVTQQQWPTELQPLARAFDKLLAQLEKDVDQLTRFSGDLAHELRTPITALRLETEVLLEKPRSEEEYQQVLQNNLEEFERLSRTIERILLLARVDSPEFQGEWLTFSARGMIEKLLGYYTYLAEEREIQLRVEGDDLSLTVDQALIEQALGNLLSNAIKYTPLGSTVHIELARLPNPQGQLTPVIQVRDIGPGIAAEHLPHVFERFYRADSSRSQLIAGDGLGLAIVKSVMEFHGGRVTLDSTEGCCFTLWFDA